MPADFDIVREAFGNKAFCFSSDKDRSQRDSWTEVNIDGKESIRRRIGSVNGNLRMRPSGRAGCIAVKGERVESAVGVCSCGVKSKREQRLVVWDAYYFCSARTEHLHSQRRCCRDGKHLVAANTNGHVKVALLSIRRWVVNDCHHIRNDNIKPKGRVKLDAEPCCNNTCRIHQADLWVSINGVCSEATRVLGGHTAAFRSRCTSCKSMSGILTQLCTISNLCCRSDWFTMTADEWSANTMRTATPVAFVFISLSACEVSCRKIVWSAKRVHVRAPCHCWLGEHQSRECCSRRNSHWAVGCIASRIYWTQCSMHYYNGNPEESYYKFLNLNTHLLYLL